MVNRQVRYKMKSQVPSGIVVQLVELTGSTLTLTPSEEFIGVAAVLPPPPPPTAQNPNPFQCSVIAYVGQFVGPTTVNIPGDDWSQAYLVYLPDGLNTPSGFGSLLNAITDAINGSSSPPPGDGTGLA